MHLHDRQSLTLDELRTQWTKAWQLTPHARIGRTMLEKSLLFKTHHINTETQNRLSQLVKQYKRDPKCFDNGRIILKPGIRLSRTWKGKRYDVMVKSDGFEYNEQHYFSLTKIANHITESKWNGYVFFGLK